MEKLELRLCFVLDNRQPLKTAFYGFEREILLLQKFENNGILGVL